VAVLALDSTLRVDFVVKCQRLLGGGRRSSFRHAAAQQGLLQIVRDFCDHTNAVCDACPFPDVVRRSYAAGKPT